MGKASRHGRPMAVRDGMIAPMARNHDRCLATRSVGDFSSCGVVLINPWAMMT